MTVRMQYCFYCGAKLGIYSCSDPLQTCGERECDRAARDEAQAEREEAHAALDRANGWD